jgi:hypothetical protein
MGFTIERDASGKVSMWCSGSLAGKEILSSASMVTGWNYVGFACNEQATGSFVHLNGVTTTGSMDQSYFPSTTDADYTFQIGAGGNNYRPMRSGNRIATVVMFDSLLTSANMDSLYTNHSGRY